MKKKNQKYGGMLSRLKPNPYMDSDPWVNLDTINEFLEDGEALPPVLARWLGEAICNAHQDKDKLLKELGLVGKQGHSKTAKHDENAWRKYGQMVEIHLGQQRLNGIDLGKLDYFRKDMLNEAKEQRALDHVASEYLNETNKDVDISTVRRWHRKYLQAKEPPQI